MRGFFPHDSLILAYRQLDKAHLTQYRPISWIYSGSPNVNPARVATPPQNGRFGGVRVLQRRSIWERIVDSPTDTRPTTDLRISMIRSRLLLLLTILISTPGAGSPAAESRTWTDASGDSQVEAHFVTFQNDKVWLHRSDGRTFGIAMSGLSRADQEYVRQQIELDRASQLRTVNSPGRIPYAPGRKLSVLANPAVKESSGLACSRANPGLFWTHNDSGGEARIYLFDSQGRDLGSSRLRGVFAFDWEDIFSFSEDGKHYLMICDVGNNGRAAGVQPIYLVEEPAIDPQRGVTQDSVPVVREIHIAYEDDHRDCEAVAVDPTSKTIFFASKEKKHGSLIYALDWPEAKPDHAFATRRIATLEIPPVTAMDISPDGLRAIVLTYAHAYEYVRKPTEDWSAGFSRPGRLIVMPQRIQGESICYGPDGKTLYLTSEKVPTPLFEIGVQ